MGGGSSGGEHALAPVDDLAAADRRQAGAQHQQLVGRHLHQFLRQHSSAALVGLAGAAVALAEAAVGAALRAGLVGVGAEPLGELLGDLQLLGREGDLDPAVGDDLLGEVGAVFGAQLGWALQHRQQAQAVAGDIGEGRGP